MCLFYQTKPSLKDSFPPALKFKCTGWKKSKQGLGGCLIRKRKFNCKNNLNESHWSYSTNLIKRIYRRSSLLVVTRITTKGTRKCLSHKNANSVQQKTYMNTSTRYQQMLFWLIDTTMWVSFNINNLFLKTTTITKKTERQCVLKSDHLFYSLFFLHYKLCIFI